MKQKALFIVLEGEILTLKKRCSLKGKISEATTGAVLKKTDFLKILQMSQETPMLESLFNKVVGL